MTTEAERLFQSIFPNVSLVMCFKYKTNKTSNNPYSHEKCEKYIRDMLLLFKNDSMHEYEHTSGILEHTENTNGRVESTITRIQFEGSTTRTFSCNKTKRSCMFYIEERDLNNNFVGKYQLTLQ